MCHSHPSPGGVRAKLFLQPGQEQPSGATRWPKDQGCCRNPIPRSSFQGSSSRAVRQVSLLRYSRPARRWGPGTGPLHPRLRTRAPRLASGSTPPRPLEGAVQGPGCSAASARRCHPPASLCRPPQPQPRPGGGVRRLGGTDGRAGTQAPSCTRAGQRRGRGPSGRTKRETRRCHCPRRWRVTPGRMFHPGAPRSTPLSTSGAPRRSNSCSRPPAACSSHTHRRPRSQKPGEPLLRAVHSGWAALSGLHTHPRPRWPPVGFSFSEQGWPR